MCQPQTVNLYAGYIDEIKFATSEDFWFLLLEPASVIEEKQDDLCIEIFQLLLWERICDHISISNQISPSAHDSLQVAAACMFRFADADIFKLVEVRTLQITMPRSSKARAGPPCLYAFQAHGRWYFTAVGDHTIVHPKVEMPPQSSYYMVRPELICLPGGSTDLLVEQGAAILAHYLTLGSARYCEQYANPNREGWGVPGMDEESA